MVGVESKDSTIAKLGKSASQIQTQTGTQTGNSPCCNCTVHNQPQPPFAIDDENSPDDFKTTW